MIIIVFCSGLGFFRDNVITKVYAFITYIDRGASDQSSYFILIFAAEGAEKQLTAIT